MLYSDSVNLRGEKFGWDPKSRYPDEVGKENSGSED